MAAGPTGIYVVGYAGGDAFIRKYDGDGNLVWTRQFGTAGYDVALGVATHANSVYVMGSTDGTFHGQTSGGSLDAFVRNYDSDGNEVWTKQFGGAEPDGFLVKITAR